MKKLSLAALLTAVLAIVPNAAHAQRSYWDPGGATVANTSSATWENALWQTVASGSSPAPSGTGLTTFTETGLCGFICTNGTGAVLGTYTVTMNANHTVAGIFNGNLTDAVSTNLQIVSGNGSKLSVVSGDQGFSTQANGNSTLNVGLTGVGNPQFQGSGSWFLWGNNSTLTGNIELTSTSVNFNNNNSFGGGFITNTATTSILATPAADGGGTANGASSPLTIANNMWLRNAASKIIFVQGSASAPVTWTGLWQCNGTSGSTITLDWRAVSSSIQSSNTIQGVISGTGINYLITNANVGTSKVVFTGANTYTGTTTIGAPSTGATGTTNAYLQIGANGTTGNLGTGAVTANNLLIFNRSDTPTVANAISGTGAVILTNATGGATFTGALSYTGGTFINSGVTLTVSGAGTMAANPITNNGTLAFNSTGNSPLSQVISGTGSITKAGSGTLTLSGLNNFTGKTAINGGLVTINAAGGAENALGTPPTGSPVADQLSFNGGAISLGSAANVTLDANRGITLNAGGGTVQGASKDLTIPGPIVGVGSLTKTGSANLLVSGNCSYNGCIITGGGFRANSDSACGTNAITIGPSSSVITFRNISPAVTTTITNNITVNGGGTSDIDVTCAVGNTFTLSGNISGGGQFLRGRAVGAQGTVVLNGNNSSWSGGLILVRGGLQLGNKNALGSGTLVVSNSATSPEAHVIQTSANLTGANAVANNVNVLNNGWIIGGANNIEFSGTVTLSSAAAAITNNNSASTILSGNITGAQPLSFQGTGTTKVTGTTTYTGATTVGGTLQVDGNITASSGVTVASGGTLKGNGVVPGTTVSGAVNPGASPGTLSVTNTLTFNAGSTNIVEINDPTGTAGANWDLINCNALAINGAMKLKVNSLTALNASGAAANFNNGNDYSLLILHATNGISAGDTTLITVDSNDFAANNTMGNGLFQVAAVTNIDLTVDLVLQFRRIAAITAQPAPTTACIGSTANISITATGSSVSYQWSKGGVNLANGQPVSGSSATVATNVTTSTLVLTGVDVNAADTYACRVQATVGSAVNSSSATLSVPTPPTIATPVADSSSTVDAGANVPLSVTLSGGTFISYQWQKGGVNLSNGAHDNAATVSGSQSANLNLTSVRAADSGVYTCIVSAAGGCGTVTSFSTTLSVNDPVITQQPANSTIQCGSSNALTVTAIGTTNANGVLTYQWYTPDASGTAITDATNSILSFPTASFANAGSYSLVVSNALGNSITSSVVVVTIQDTNGPVISVNVGTDTVECHTSFIDAGATANDACDGSVIVTTTGSVDTNSVNFYTLTYSASDSHGNSSTATRVVTVHDTTAPTLSLLGSPVTTISCGTPYSDAGATASDTCAGDLTSQIAVNYGGLVPGAPVAGDYTITYNVSDPSLNPATPVTRVVHVIDTVPPVVTLIGNAVVTNECHTAFADPGATANDACSGNVTGSIVITGNLNTNSVGVYTVTYVADDGAGNTNASVTRVIHVVDTTNPTIGLNGAASVTNECQVAYIELGAIAGDTCDGSPSVVTNTTPTLNDSAPTVGVYTRTYTVTDASGNSASITRTITVLDTTAPDITVLGSLEVDVECHTSYVDAGATATDSCEGSASVTTNNPVNTNVVGTYTVTYSSSDSVPNTATAYRVVHVVDHTDPVVTINGSSPITIECHGGYTDAGATASDTCAGDVSGSIVASGVPDSNALGTYTITYTATDGNGNSGTATRVVTVSDTAAPVFTVLGSSPMNVECHGSFTDPGATANDACAGPVAVTTNNPVNANAVGDYTITYAATDGTHASSAIRVVHVTDGTQPLITLAGPAVLTNECHVAYIDAGASASDDCSGDLTSQIVVDLGGLDTNSPALGVYTLTFSVTDGAGNHSSTTRQVTVRDTVPPVITVTLGVTTVECHTSYNDAGATVADDCDASPTLGSIGSVDANTPNDYTITYTAQDATGNTSTATRVVHVIDNIPPVVTLNGDPSVTIECHSLYNELGATVTDACDTNVTVSIINGVDTNTPSVYVLTYSSTDASGNTGTKTRTVTVNDTQPPLMALNGLASVDVECHSAYTELGATATDACEGNIVVGPPTGTVETNALGDYTLTYSACDSGAHCASIIRVVHVVDHTAPLVTVTGATTVDICLGSAYTELGATASDTCEGSLPASISGGTVDTNAVGSYTLTYAATDGSGNTGTATRVVNVSDCGISITTQPADKLKQPQGATVTLSVVATAPLGTLSYQWYEQNVAVDSTTNPTATNATFIFTAHTNAAAPHFTNVTYNVVISGQDNHTATSANAHVTVIVDKAPPTVVLSSPKANARSDSFTIIGTATDPDKSGTIAKIVYQYTNSNGGGTAMFTNTFNAPTNKYTFTIPGVTFPAGTNTLYVWAMDLAGHINFAKPAVVKGLFSRVTDTFTLNLVGDGNGTVTASTKGSALESVSGLPLSGGAVNASVVLNLNKYQLYTLTFTPDTATNAPISSVVSNAPSTLNVAGSVNIANSDSIRKVTYTFMFNGAESHTVYFNRNRKKDMAGVYNGVFSEDGNPSIASSGLVQNMNIGATGTYTVKLLNVGVLSPTIKGIIAADGTTTGLSTDGKYVLQGFLDWSGSATNGPKQFIGTVSNTIAGWSSSFIADRTEKSLLTAGTKKTMIIPSMAGGPSGDSFATIKDTSGSSRSFAFTLADNAKLVTYTAAATASGNFPIYIYPKYATTTDSHAQSVLFGTWNTASNQVTLNWVKAAGGVYNPDGFTNAHLADISSFTTGLSGDHIVTITNVPTGLGLAYRMHFDGTNLVTHLTDHLYPSTNSIAVKQDSTGKITVTFGNPGPKVKSTGYAGVVENNSTNGVASGFFIPLGGTNSGVISIVPAP